jgi:hypothetical protein
MRGILKSLGRGLIWAGVRMGAKVPLTAMEMEPPTCLERIEPFEPNLLALEFGGHSGIPHEHALAEAATHFGKSELLRKSICLRHEDFEPILPQGPNSRRYKAVLAVMPIEYLQYRLKSKGHEWG